MSRALDILRLLLGAVLVLTAIEYFLPPLTPLATASWEDPMAARVMTALDRSGLLAVARFIHLAGGMLLLLDRKVPFALAALMPVNVCATYIALLLEGDTLLAVLALLLLALNALLMFAYLPAYRDMLSAGQIAHGEGPQPGDNYESLMVNPFSDAPARAYLGAAIALIAAIAFFYFVVPGLNGTTGLVTLAFPALVLAMGASRALKRRA